MKYSVFEAREVDRQTGVISDESISLTGLFTAKRYPDLLRLVVYEDYAQNVAYRFLTNDFTLEAITIAELYRERWTIETFFYDKYIVMQSKVRSISDNQGFVRLLLTSTSHNNSQCPRPLSQSRRSLLFSHSLSEFRLGTRSAYAFSNASRLAFESALA